MKKSQYQIQKVAEINRRISQGRYGEVRETTTYKNLQNYLEVLRRVDPTQVSYVPNTGRKVLKFTTDVSRETLQFIEQTLEDKELTKTGLKEVKKDFDKGIKSLLENWGEDGLDNTQDSYTDRFYRMWKDKDVQTIVNKYKNSRIFPSNEAVIFAQNELINMVGMTKVEVIEKLEDKFKEEALKRQSQKFTGRGKRYDRQSSPFN